MLIGAVVTAVLAVIRLSEPTYTIVDEGQVYELTGRFDQIADVLEESDLLLRAEDVVLPSPEAEPHPDVPIEIQRARQIVVRHPSGTRTYWTHQTRLSEFIAEADLLISPTSQLIADGDPVPLDALYTAPLPETLEIGRSVTVTIQRGAQTQVLQTTAVTVEEALDDADIILNDSDTVYPPLDNPLVPELLISIEPGFSVTIVVDGSIIQTRTGSQTVQEVLNETGITTGPLDYTQPPLDTPLSENLQIQLIRVTEELLTQDEAIPYQTLWQASAEMEIDTQGLISAGQPGIKRTQIRVRYENGVEVSRTIDGEWVEQEPVNEVYGYGTQIVLRTIDTPEGPREYWRVVRMRVTSYTAASSGRAADDPLYGITASGRPAGYGIVAIDRNIVPFRSSVYVPNYGVAFAGDTGGGVRGRWIDLGYDENNFQSWSGYVDVYYLSPVPNPADINYLLPAAPP